MARRRAPTSIRQARARKVKRSRISRTRTTTRTTGRGTTTRTTTGVRLGRAGRGGTGIRRTIASSFRPKPRVVRKVQAPQPRIKSSSRRVRRVRKPVRVQRASRGGTGISFAVKRKAQAKALRNPIKNFVATSIGSVKGAGKATRQLIDTEIADFNIRTKRKGTDVEFPSTSKFIDFFGVTEIGK